MTSKRDELLKTLRHAEELGLPVPFDTLLQLTAQDTDEKIRAIDLTIKPEDLPLFTLTQPGAVPASHRPGLILTSTGWAPPPKIPASKPPVYLFGGGGGGGGGSGTVLPANAIGWLHNDGLGNLIWSTPAGGGNVFGSAPTVVNNFAAFDNLTGTLIKDSGFNAASFQPAGNYQPLNTILTTLSGLANAAGILTNNGAGVLAWIAIPATHAPVTLDANADTLLSLSTQTLGLDTQTAAYVFAGPAIGVAAVPTFRALVATDIPALNYQAPITTGPALLGNGAMQYQVIVTGPNPFAPVYSGFLLDGTTGGKTIFAVTNTKTLTLTSTGDFNLTIPATGIAALGTGTANYATRWTGTNILGNSIIQDDGTTIGIGVASAAARLVKVQHTLSSDPGVAAYAGFFTVQPQVALNWSTAALAGFAYSVHTTGVITEFLGLDFKVLNQFGGTLDMAYALRVQVSNWSGVGDIWNGFGVYIMSPDAGGLYFNMYGLYIADQIQGRHLCYAIYTNKGINRIGDQVSIVGSVDRQQLIVTGFTTQTTATPMVQLTRNDAAAGISAMLGLTALGSGTNGDGGSILLNGKTSTTADTAMGLDQWLWVDATHASRKARRVFNVYDTAVREAFRIEASGAAAALGFYGHAAAVQPTKAGHNNWANISDVVQALVDIGILDAV